MIMPSKIAKDNIAVCGVNCLSCSAYLNKNNPCPGCAASREKHTRKSCKDCIKKECAFEQGLRWCFECKCFPCSKIKNLNKRYKQNYDIDLVQNGLSAKQNMDVFLQAQNERFMCKSCNGVIDQHHKKCSECEMPITN